MHILFLTDNFPPEVNAPASRTYEHCREWVKEGHKVTIITCVPNFPKGIVFDGYVNRFKTQHENYDGIKVLRVWSYISSNDGFILRILDYISFMVSSTIASLNIKNVDIVIGTSPQFFTVCAGYITGKLKRAPFIFEVRDLWPESIKAVGAIKCNLILKSLESLELFLYSKAAAIICVTASFKNNLIKRGVNRKKVFIVTNGVDLIRFNNIVKDDFLTRKLNLSDKFVVGYIGTHGMAHALGTILDAAESMQQDKEKDIVFLMLGDGAERKNLIEESYRREIKNIQFIESVRKEEVTKYWSILDAGIIHLKKVDTFKSVIPSKLFESMAIGLPVVHGVEGESAEIVKNLQIGITFKPEDSLGLCSAIKRLKNDTQIRKQYKINSLKEVKHYDRRKKAKQFLKILCKI